MRLIITLSIVIVSLLESVNGHKYVLLQNSIHSRNCAVAYYLTQIQK